MNIKGIIAFSGAKSLSNQENKANKKSTISTIQTNKENNLPTFAWKANRLPFASIKMASDEFKSRMKAKIDRVKNNTQEKVKLTQAELGEMKVQALKNISGPLVLKCDAICSSVLKDLNNEFAKVCSIDDLNKLLNDPRIPEDKPIIISEPSSKNFDKFIKDVDKANTSDSLETAVKIVDKATNELDNEEVVMPEVTIRTSSKAIAKGLIQHIKADLDYDPVSVITSPFFAFKTGDELAVDLFIPVYEK